MTDSTTSPRSTGRVLKISEVVELTTLSRATIYRQEAAGRFPKRRKLAPQREGWPADQVEAWLRDLPEPRGPARGPEKYAN